MTTQDTISTVQELADKIGDSPVQPKQYGQLARSMGVALEKVGIMGEKTQKPYRMAILELFVGRKIESSRQLPNGLVLALISRWTQETNPFAPTEECLADVSVLVREVALKHGQMELNV